MSKTSLSKSASQSEHQQHDIIVIGASAGGVDALISLVSTLPPDLAAAIFVVLHLPPGGYSVMHEILTRNGKLPATHAVDGEAIKYGRIYIAPPDHHLTLEQNRMRVIRGPTELP